MIEIIIQPNGDLLIPRGEASQNEFFRNLFKDIIDADQMKSLNDFFGISDDSEMIFGETGLCG